MRLMSRLARWPVLLTGVLLALLAAAPALAAEVAGGDSYRLEAGEVIADDLYVSAAEVIIAGTVEGDLIAAGAYIEVSGRVTGDATLAGAAVVVSGTIDDDLRAAAAGLDVSGTVGDDLLAGGGGGGFAAPFVVAGRNVVPGVRIADSAQVGGDALLAGGQGTIAGTIDEDLRAAMGDLTLAAQVGGDARLASERIAVQTPAQIDGVLRYTSAEPISAPDGVAADVVYVAPPAEPAPAPGEQALAWALRTLLVLLGFALLGGLLLRVWPAALLTPARAIAARPGRASLYGSLALIFLMALPLLSALLVFLMVLFWGWWPGVVLGLALFGMLGLLWFLSPLITGAWLGRWLARATGRAPDAWLAALSGVLLLALLMQIPYLGWLVAPVSFVLALGGLLLARRTPDARAEPVMNR
ncbi:polymer-forming cytoskeletal protein [Oscillochloris sp. ZM17-4]|uniref:polymer-forming cytoskeletal protein n=1 Tax=Oscillochloris sp. ZM17-4 TaxID=2866714 RepID=UPI001C72C1B6|nr:polymer-forming cytoskeletal protein [Oscillochloris sp. ZM17-4]MBX0329673.1 polymer-forming cytoskeletal protein [Oscillochloris sp. ZM17-4]